MSIRVRNVRYEGRSTLGARTIQVLVERQRLINRAQRVRDVSKGASRCQIETVRRDPARGRAHARATHGRTRRARHPTRRVRDEPDAGFGRRDARAGRTGECSRFPRACSRRLDRLGWFDDRPRLSRLTPTSPLSRAVGPPGEARGRHPRVSISHSPPRVSRSYRARRGRRARRRGPRDAGPTRDGADDDDDGISSSWSSRRPRRLRPRARRHRRAHGARGSPPRGCAPARGERRAPRARRARRRRDPRRARRRRRASLRRARGPRRARVRPARARGGRRTPRGILPHPRQRRARPSRARGRRRGR